MRMSCNGCRVLRKGCTGDCSLRHSLQWIQSPDSQANATVFLAKFYGRAGLMNLITAGPPHLRPAICKSLLYEACGRIINPIYGSVGLLWSGNWAHCQLAVDEVLKGSPIIQMPTEDAISAAHPIMPLKGCDIRHVTKDSTDQAIHRVRTRNRFKRSGRDKGQADSVSGEILTEPAQFSISSLGEDHMEELNRAPSHDSSMLSAETVEASLVKQAEPDLSAVKTESQSEESEVGLELTLGLNPVLQPHLPLNADV